MFVFVFTSCIHDNISSSVEEDKGFGLTVKEAKTFWENQILTRSTPQTTITLDPGDYIPVWDKAFYLIKIRLPMLIYPFLLKFTIKYYVVISLIEISKYIKLM